MPRRYLSEMPEPPALIRRYDGDMAADQVSAQWVTPFDPQEVNEPEPPLLEVYQSNLAQRIDRNRKPCPEDWPDDQPHPDYQPALSHVLDLLEAQGWTLVEDNSGKDFNSCILRQPEQNAWQPTKTLFAELSGYNREPQTSHIFYRG